ncbi:hypothetical protein HF086_008973 [Spodoptera exigua]|uniref:PiggyBac transposable element-derived protein domain-containing protein n=1 Tax=Spodoptera exigua TaxID=7107 RepID=A0A922MUI6_SPOEX|nr:hypothetical protein HF086_008973 [Spodoptera exigua]
MQSDLGLGAAVIIELHSRLPEELGPYNLYFDNFFTGLPLLKYLREQNVGGTGTVQENRLENCSLPNSKDMKKEPRAIIKMYNKYMGGVDRFEENVDSMRVALRGKKWWFPLFAFGLDAACQNAWLIKRQSENNWTYCDFRRNMQSNLYCCTSAASLTRGCDIVSDLSDTESIVSGTNCGSTRQSRKRAFLRQDSRGSPDQAEKPPKRAVIQADLEERIAAKEQRTRTTRAKAGYGASSVLYADHSVEEMERMALEDQLEILEVASKSSNLKGTFQKALKCRAASLLGIVKELAQRTTSDETRQLQAKVDRLQKEVSALHARVAELMARPEVTSEGPASMLAPSNLEDIIRKVVMEERAFTRACFAGIEDRLLPEKRLRPPLAADRAPERTPSAPGPSTAPAQHQPKGKGKGKGKKTTPAAPTAQTVPQDLPREDPLLPSTTPSNQPWTKVVPRKRKGKKTVSPKPPAAKPAAAVEKRKKLPLPPKSAAVVVTLTPEAAERGETYESVLRRARANVDPAQLGAGRVTCRKTQTGARIFEFSGAQGGTKAELFAAKLREAVADTAKVVRPVKCVALEVTDLDDSVTQEEVVAAVAAVGGAAPSNRSRVAPSDQAAGHAPVSPSASSTCGLLVVGGADTAAGRMCGSQAGLYQEPAAA